MMTVEQFRLMKLIEECSEVQKRCAKQQAFGRDQHEEGYDPNHWRLREEILDVLSVIKLLEYYGTIKPVTDAHVRAHFNAKREKIVRMSTLSVRQGTVTPELLNSIPEYL